MENNNNVLEIRGLNSYFFTEKGVAPAVDGLDLDIPKGKIIGLVGESGCGKSTLGRTLIRMLPATRGSVTFEGQNITAMKDKEFAPLRRRMQMVFQDPYASLDPRMKVRDIIAEPLETYHVCKTKAETTHRVLELMQAVGVPAEFLNRYPHQFSGGQRQRIGIARALIVEPEFIIADEPISALDMSIRAQVLNLLRHLQKERGITYLFIAHDLSVMRYISDRIAVIHKGDIVELADAEELVTHAIHPYTRSLLSAIPMPNPRLERKKKLLVYDPAMHDYTQEAPQWRELRPSHWVLCSEQEAKDWLAEM